MIATSRQAIRKFSGAIMGYIESDNKGNRRVTDFYGRILGYYNPNTDSTHDFAGRYLSSGDTLAGLLYANEK